MSDPGERAAELVELVVDALALQATVAVDEAGDEITVTVDGEDLGLFIGRHGHTIEAVQHLAQCIAFADGGERRRLVVDAAGYRARRREALEALADEAADGVVDGGRIRALEPMSAAERRIVHEHLRDRDGIETYSEGDEPRRRLVIAPRDS